MLDEVEVEAVKYIKYSDLAEKYREQDPSLVPADMNGPVRSSSLFDGLHCSS